MWRCQQTQQHEPFAKCDAPIWNDPVALVLLSEAKHPCWIPHGVRNDKKSMRNDIALVLLSEAKHPRNGFTSPCFGDAETSLSLQN